MNEVHTINDHCPDLSLSTYLTHTWGININHAMLFQRSAKINSLQKCKSVQNMQNQSCSSMPVTFKGFKTHDQNGG